jgi:hypothetical protein
LTAWAEHKGREGLAAYREQKNQRSIDGRAYPCEVAQIAALSFVGPLNAVVNTQAVARDLGGNVVLSNLLVRPSPTGRP